MQCSFKIFSLLTLVWSLFGSGAFNSNAYRLLLTLSST